jgi:DUF4097 and DUF4098 domain-containing protein YvlB
VSDRYQFDIDGHARLVISLQSGDVEVYPSPNGGIEASLTGKTAGVTVEQVGNTVSITSEKKTSIFTSTNVRVAVGVPEGCDLELSGATVDLVSRQRLGAVKARTASGDIRLTDADDLVVKTASGEVRFDAVHGHCEVTAASGDVIGDAVAGDFKANLASGDVRVGRIAGDVSVKSASGDAQIDRAEGYDIAIRSMSGDITIGLPPGIRLDFDLDALSGDISLPAPPAPPPPPRPPEPGSEFAARPVEPEAKRHRKTVRVYAKTVSGDITIERAV